MSQSATLSAPASVTVNGPAALQSAVPLAGRILLAPLFLLSGLSKIAAPAVTIGMIAGSGLPFATLGFALAVLVEVGGGTALLAGYRTRLVAAVMALFTLATALAFHANFADQNQFIHFFKNLAIAGGLLQLVAYGAGRLSLDARRR
ncbi:DoxX family protein [Sphingobium sp. EM0848]|uniref:DoxX family protein n=1 Tax=Sphingobium sp. EM0848 TaxID=2743473 RepID=UPI00159C6EC6|nr:DoxX family protein [Sphingobium sp. EM0848]